MPFTHSEIAPLPTREDNHPNHVDKRTDRPVNATESPVRIKTQYGECNLPCQNQIRGQTRMERAKPGRPIAATTALPACQAIRDADNVTIEVSSLKRL